MKKIVCLLLALCFGVLCLAGCGKTAYPPVKSTAEEARTAVTLSYGGRTYKVRYELYRAFFLTYREEIDGGDLSVWAGADKETYRARINEKILQQAADIYAVEALCREIGFDQYDKDADEAVEEFIRISVEGGEADGADVEGVGSYEAYLAELKKQFINYSVQDLIYRYYLGTAALDEHFCGDDSAFISEFSFGSTVYSEADLKAFYESDSVVRVLWCYLPGAVYDTEEKLQNVRDRILAAKDAGLTDTDCETRVGGAMIGATTAAADDVLNGQLVTRDNLDENLYGEISSVALSLKASEVSEPISVKSDLYDGYFILYRTTKPDSYFTSHTDDVKTAFQQDALGKKIRAVRDEMIASAQFSSDIASLDLSTVGMD